MRAGGEPLWRAKIWYLFTGASGVCISPYYNVYFLQKGLNETTIGSLSALRTWVPAIAAFMWSGVADKHGIHKLIVLVGFVASTFLRTSLAFANTTLSFFSLVAASELIGAGVGPIIDAAVVAACTEEGDYGKQRLWASLGWGGLSAFAGMVITSYGIRAGFIGYAALAVPCVVTALGMTFNTKRRTAGDPSSPRGAYQELPASPLGLRTRASSSLSCEIAVAVPVEAVGLIAAFQLDESLTHPHGDLHPHDPACGCPCSTHATAGETNSLPSGTPHALHTFQDLSHPTADAQGHSTPSGGFFGVARRTASFPGLAAAVPTPFATHNITPPAAHVVGMAGPCRCGAGPQGACTNPRCHAQRHSSPGEPPRQQQPGSNTATTVGLQHPAHGKTPRGPALTIQIHANAAGPTPHSGCETFPTGRDPASSVPIITSLASSKAAAATKPWPKGAPQQAAWADDGTEQLRVWGSAADLREAGIDAAVGWPRLALDDKHPEGLVVSVGAGMEPVASSCACSLAGEAQEGYWRSLQLLLSCPQVLVFMLKTVVMGYALGIIGNYLFVYLQQLHGSATLMGLSLTVTCCSEVPAFWAQGWVLKRLRVTTIQHLVMACYTTRLILYSCLGVWGTPWAVLPVELLHGVTFGLAWGAGTVNCRRLAPPGLEATMQGLFSGLYYGVGQGLGGLLGGMLMHRYGSAATFYYSAVVVVAGWVLCTLLEGLIALQQWLAGRRAGGGLLMHEPVYEPVSAAESAEWN